jgi:hypothetical protein
MKEVGLSQYLEVLSAQRGVHSRNEPEKAQNAKKLAVSRELPIRLVL